MVRVIRHLFPAESDRIRSARAGSHAAPASDVWGLGATLFEAIAGYRPFDDPDPDAPDPEDRHPQLVQPPYELPARTPPEVAKIVFAMLEHRPEHRPTPVEVGEVLEPVLERQPTGRLAGFKVAR